MDRFLRPKAKAAPAVAVTVDEVVPEAKRAKIDPVPVPVPAREAVPVPVPVLELAPALALLGEAKIRGAAKGKAKAKAKGKSKSSLAVVRDTGVVGDEALTPEKAVKTSAEPRDDTIGATTKLGEVARAEEKPEATALLPDLQKIAHQLIDFARDGRWAELYKVLDGLPDAMNVRPSVREFGVLHQAAFHGELEVVSTLVKKYGADPTLSTQSGKLAVEIAKEQGHVDIAEFLVPCKTPPGPTSLAPASGAAGPSSSCTPIPALTPDIAAASHKLIDLAKAGSWEDLYKTLDARPDLVNVRPEVRDYSTLHQAAFSGQAEAVATLIDKYGADPAQGTKFGKSAREIAEEHGHSAVVDVLSARLGAGAREVPGAAATPAKVVVIAPVATTENLAVAHKLIDFAKEGQWTSVYETLVSHPDAVNVRPAVREYGVIHQAAFHGTFDAVRTLIEKYGADPELCTKFGRSVVDVANEEGHHKLAEMLRSRYLSHGEGEGESDIEMVQMPDGTWKVSVSTK